MEVFTVLSQDKVLHRFVEQIIDDDKVGWTGFNSVPWSRTSKRPASCMWQSGVGLVVPFSNVIKFARAVSRGNLDSISSSSSSVRHLPVCFCDSYGGLWKNFLLFLRTRRSHLKILFFLRDPCIAPRMRQFLEDF